MFALILAHLTVWAADCMLANKSPMHCQFLLEELRAQVEEETNRNLYILTMFSVIFLPATLIASIWGMNVGGIPFSGSPNGFWVVAGLIAAVFTLVALVLFRFRFRLF
jgi:zinc transporter